MVEKPKPGTAPSNLHISGRYILQPEIFDLLSAGERGAGGEIQITDAMIGSPRRSPSTPSASTARSTTAAPRLGFLAANVAYALDRKDIGPALRAGLAKLL